jgi:hypothetical protein
MSQDEREDHMIYKVVVNHEEQYSIWPADRDTPLGWSEWASPVTKQIVLPTSKRFGRICARSACARKWQRWQRKMKTRERNRSDAGTI